MQTFRFEHTCRVSLDDYLSVRYGFVGINTRTRWGIRVALLLVAVACLFSRYTLLLGLALIARDVVNVAVRGRGGSVFGDRYRSLTYLHHPVTYGADPDRLWLRGQDLSVDAGWPQVAVCLETDRWLVVSLKAIGEFMLPVQEMKREHAYEPLLAHVARMGIPVRRPPAPRRAREAQ